MKRKNFLVALFAVVIFNVAAISLIYAQEPTPETDRDTGGNIIMYQTQHYCPEKEGYHNVCSTYRGLFDLRWKCFSNQCGNLIDY